MAYKELLGTLKIEESDIRPITEEEAERLKKTLLEAYLEIQKVCNDNNLDVMLVGGSALGAVRHKGFIPWDDDLDIAMPREDFEKFKTIFDKELGDKYGLNAPNYSQKSNSRFAKIMIKDTLLVELGAKEDDDCCIKLDLFIIENVPSKKALQLLNGIKCSIYMFIAGQVDTYEGQSDLEKSVIAQSEKLQKAYKRRLLLGKIFSFRNASKWHNTVDKACRYKKKTNLLGIPTGRKHYFGEILPKEVFLPVTKAIFEGEEVNLPSNPDMYLRNLFGDYMKVPEKEKREKHLISKISFIDEQGNDER